MSESRKIRVGSRKSELALIQTKHVISLLKQINPEMEFEIVTMNTLGDTVLDIPLPKIGEKSLFTKELETALINGSVDFVVHSLKDLPTALPNGMAIGAVLEREDPRDALVLQKNLSLSSLSELPKNSVIGTSSLRRTAQLAKKYPHLKVESIRGNLNTRLKKLDDLGKFQAIILAAAGLIRIGWKDRISKVLETDELLYAVGQGALAVECRENDDKTIKLLEPLYDARTALQVLVERSFLKTLGGGCSAPVAVCSKIQKKGDSKFKVQLEGAVWSLDGKDEIKETDSFELNVVNGLKCALCPVNIQNKTSGLEDIECIRECTSCSIDGPSPAKKIKLDIAEDVLNEDPHEKCPVQIPIGAEFMGKCPYLAGDLEALKEYHLEEIVEKCPFMHNNVIETKSENNVQTSVPSTSSCPIGCINGNEGVSKKLHLEEGAKQRPMHKKDIARSSASASSCSIESISENEDNLKTYHLEEVNKCPMHQNGVENPSKSKTRQTVPTNNTNENDNLFIGLVPHKKISLENMKKARELGKRLAEKLAEKGAMKVMERAQAIVHSQTNTVNGVST